MSTIAAGWSSPVARQAHNLKAAGSNPAPATRQKTPPSWRGFLFGYETRFEPAKKQVRVEGPGERKRAETGSRPAELNPAPATRQKSPSLSKATGFLLCYRTTRLNNSKGTALAIMA